MRPPRHVFVRPPPKIIPEPVERVEARVLSAGFIDVVDAAAAEHGVTRALVLGRDRHKPTAAARRSLYRLLKLRGLSYPRIATLLGRDHTTVLQVATTEGWSNTAATRIYARNASPRCRFCGALYDDHQARAPHPHILRGCPGFAHPAEQAVG